MANPFVHLELTTPDTTKAKEFYGKLFSWIFTDNDMGGGMIYSTFKPDDGPGGGMMTMPGAPPNGSLTWASTIFTLPQPRQNPSEPPSFAMFVKYPMLGGSRFSTTPPEP